MKAEKTVDVTVNYCGKDQPGKMGFYVRKRPEYIDGEWVDTDEDETIFGYCDSVGYMTQMCYGSSYVNWDEMASLINPHSGKQYDEMYLDAGSNGRPMYIERAELQRAMKELDLIK